MSLAILFHLLCAEHVPDINISYEQYYIQTLYREDKLIPEQCPGETNPLFQMAINPQTPHTT